MGLPVAIYRAANGTDCTNDGASSRFQAFTLINVDGPFDPSDHAPAAILEPIRGKIGVRIVPLEDKESGKWVMFGGNFAYSSDSRLSRAVEAITGQDHYGAVAIHDRIES